MYYALRFCGNNQRRILHFESRYARDKACEGPLQDTMAYPAAKAHNWLVRAVRSGIRAGYVPPKERIEPWEVPELDMDTLLGVYDKYELWRYLTWWEKR